MQRADITRKNVTAAIMKSRPIASVLQVSTSAVFVLPITLRSVKS